MKFSSWETSNWPATKKNLLDGKKVNLSWKTEERWAHIPLFFKLGSIKRFPLESKHHFTELDFLFHGALTVVKKDPKCNFWESFASLRFSADKRCISANMQMKLRFESSAPFPWGCGSHGWPWGHDWPWGGAIWDHEGHKRGNKGRDMKGQKGCRGPWETCRHGGMGAWGHGSPDGPWGATGNHDGINIDCDKEKFYLIFNLSLLFNFFQPCFMSCTLYLKDYRPN
jgi:hypothetical protein